MAWRARGDKKRICENITFPKDERKKFTGRNRGIKLMWVDKNLPENRDVACFYAYV